MNRSVQIVLVGELLHYLVSFHFNFLTVILFSTVVAPFHIPIRNVSKVCSFSMLLPMLVLFLIFILFLIGGSHPAVHRGLLLDLYIQQCLGYFCCAQIKLGSAAWKANTLYLVLFFQPIYFILFLSWIIGTPIIYRPYIYHIGIPNIPYPVGMWWYFIMSLICISSVIIYVDHVLTSYLYSIFREISI